MGTSAAGNEKNVEYFPDIRQKARNSREKKQNVSKIEKSVDELGLGINQNINQVYNMDVAGETSQWGSAVGDSGGRTFQWGAAVEDSGRRSSLWEAAAGDDGGGTAILRPAELEDAPTGRDGGRDSGSVPPRGAETGWISGGAAGTWTPAGDTGSPGAPASEEMRWAEQADRAFRRDSRRYDGGFYLY